MQNRIQIGLQSDLDPIPKIEQKKTPNIISTNKDFKNVMANLQKLNDNKIFWLLTLVKLFHICPSS